MSGDRAAGAWTAWPVLPDQLEIPVEITWPDREDWPQASDQGERDG